MKEADPSLSVAGSDRIRRIAINTGGGDAPGLNAVIRAVVLSCLFDLHSYGRPLPDVRRGSTFREEAS